MSFTTAATWSDNKIQRSDHPVTTWYDWALRAALSWSAVLRTKGLTSLCSAPGVLVRAPHQGSYHNCGRSVTCISRVLMDLLTYYWKQSSWEGERNGQGSNENWNCHVLQRKTFANTKTSLKNILKSCIPRPLCRSEEDPLSVQKALRLTLWLWNILHAILHAWWSTGKSPLFLAKHHLSVIFTSQSYKFVLSSLFSAYSSLLPIDTPFYAVILRSTPIDSRLDCNGVRH